MIHVSKYRYFRYKLLQKYGLAGGDSQVFDMLVDYEGNYLLGGHTTVGDGVVNWDYLALKAE